MVISWERDVETHTHTHTHTTSFKLRERERESFAVRCLQRQTLGVSGLEREREIERD